MENVFDFIKAHHEKWFQFVQPNSQKMIGGVSDHAKTHVDIVIMPRAESARVDMRKECVKAADYDSYLYHRYCEVWYVEDVEAFLCNKQIISRDESNKTFAKIRHATNEWVNVQAQLQRFTWLMDKIIKYERKEMSEDDICTRLAYYFKKKKDKLPQKR